MSDSLVIFTLLIFALTTLFIMWRPRGINEAVPAFVGSGILLLMGIVPLSDVREILEIVSGPALTIISTIIMCIVLETIGVFRWAAYNIIKRANGSGIKLFWYIIILCFLMTIFFNNDGSILLTTPIIIHIVTMLKLTKKQKFPYLFGGVFVATASSLPIGVSNIANLIGLQIVGLDLISYTNMVLVPSMIGICTLSLLIFLLFKKSIPKKVDSIQDESTAFIMSQQIPLLSKKAIGRQAIDVQLLKICLGIVILVRASYFILTPLGINIEWIALVGAAILIVIRWFKTRIGVYDIIKKAPWHILVFAFGMYVIVYALNNTGLPVILVEILKEPMSQNLLYASFLSGIMITVLSNLMNNLPSVMLGVLMITEMGLDIQTLQFSYIAIIIGSDIGALLTPLGTLATLLWMYVLKRENIHVTWVQYLKVAIFVIPLTLFVTLLSLYLWVTLIYL
ncbi:arsenic transporter [Halalkalibacter nanhaiisediminis]|uniref:Arsenical pump membrane protein n=1 Tax=Halalkalibacter nanhaiisediminis TaxID=688079 RepID=A0A562QSQ2_9BACI|nr:arsenic transporter [Halalkalibacter nanhaiisediminis]TWI59116.1 arsenical pump membrane protein [Halalkalibacter nanhaiisediminis]